VISNILIGIVIVSIFGWIFFSGEKPKPRRNLNNKGFKPFKDDKKYTDQTWYDDWNG
jgi:hypothetical protein